MSRRERFAREHGGSRLEDDRAEALSLPRREPVRRGPVLTAALPRLVWLAEPYVVGRLRVVGYDCAIGAPAWLADLIAQGAVRDR